MLPIDLLKSALLEDAPKGDLTCRSLNLENEKSIGFLLAKQDLILSGEDFIKSLPQLELGIEAELFFHDGKMIRKGQKIAQIFGPWKNLVLIERSLLNIIGHLSGIATLTFQYSQAIKHTKCKILDTRKTTPLFRNLEKKAVRDGGGVNHRMNLSDEIMLKENHICKLTHDLKSSLLTLKRNYPNTKITVECQNIEQVELVSQTGINQILLDNMTNEMLMEAVQIIPENIKSEASGNMTLDRVATVAEIGVDYISVGAITHSAPVADISFLID